MIATASPIQNNEALMAILSSVSRTPTAISARTLSALLGISWLPRLRTYGGHAKIDGSQLVSIGVTTMPQSLGFFANR
jgi:hypothetical protein